MAKPDLHLLVVDAPFYAEITEELVAGALEVLKEAEVTFDRISVPGVLEIPAAVAMAYLAEDDDTPEYDGYVLLGCVIRGETTHYDIVANESARAIMTLAVEEALAIGNGILTVENADQAWTRARRDQKNKGGVAAAAALQMARLKRKLGA